MSERRAPFVQIPCAIIDEIMPKLRDTEFRILLVVFRQTLGRRQVDGKTKVCDWLSHSQLRQRTGRAGEAVSSAVDELVRRELLRVHDEHGKALATTHERRSVRGRLYYSLGPIFIGLAPRSLKTEVAKSKMTTEALMPVYSPCRFSEDSASYDATTGVAPVTNDRKGVLKQAIRDRLAILSK